MADLERGSNNLTDDAVCRAHENGRAKGPSKEGERWLLAVVQNTSDVVTVVDADGTVRYVSPSIEWLLGYLPWERMGRSDGSWRQVELTGTNLLDDKTIRGIVINWRDVTDHKRAEQALKESEQRFGSSFRDAAIGMALVGTDGRWLQVNRSLCKIVGYSEAE